MKLAQHEDIQQGKTKRDLASEVYHLRYSEGIWQAEAASKKRALERMEGLRNEARRDLDALAPLVDQLQQKLMAEPGLRAHLGDDLADAVLLADMTCMADIRKRQSRVEGILDMVNAAEGTES